MMMTLGTHQGRATVRGIMSCDMHPQIACAWHIPTRRLNHSTANIRYQMACDVHIKTIATGILLARARMTGHAPQTKYLEANASVA